jgi:transposase-like protein
LPGLRAWRADHGPEGRLLPLQCQCKEDFTVRTGTIFERSHVPLHKWVYAMYLLVTARKGISSLQLAKEIGVTQKSAWFMLHRLREACGSKSRS